MDLFLCGDVMTGRGIDQILAHPGEPKIYERGTTSALTYVDLAERRSGGPIPRSADPQYIWGDALGEILSRSEIRIINLETSITASDRPFPKGINYRMHPANVSCLVAASIDCCGLANNHVIDWGTGGLLETIATLRRAGIAVAGAGRSVGEAAKPAVVQLAQGRAVVFAFGARTSGIPASWGATRSTPGIALLPDLSIDSADLIVNEIAAWKQPRDVAIVSVHWGGNWGYDIPADQQFFAHRLVDSGQVDIVHGHSAHHAKGIEVYRGRLILYGCGDFISDYEGITGHSEFSPELVLAYFCRVDASSGMLDRLQMVPFRSDRFRLRRCSNPERDILAGTLQRECYALGTRVEVAASGVLQLCW